jgi:hypothetical protein
MGLMTRYGTEDRGIGGSNPSNGKMFLSSRVETTFCSVGIRNCFSEDKVEIGRASCRERVSVRV